MANWRRGLGAYLVWLVANALAAAAFAPLAPSLFGFDSRIIFEGLYAGAVFGVAQWLALRPFLVDVRLWAPVTLVASPASWSFGMTIGVLSLGIGGWLGTTISASAQCGVLLWSSRSDRLMFGLSFLWLAVGVVGGAVFYFFLLAALSTDAHPPTIELIVAGGIGYGVVTGLVVAPLAALEAGRSAAPAVKSKTT
jgi:hypothetical protein